MKPLALIRTTLITLAGASLSAFGDVVVTNPEVVPKDDIVLQQVPAGDFHFNYSWNEDYEIGQSFFAPSNLTVSSITLPITLAPGGALKPFTLKVHKVASVNEPPSEESVVFTQSGTLPSALVDDAFLTFTAQKPIELEEGNYYIFILASSTPESSVNFPLHGTDSFADESFTWYKDEGLFERYENRSLTIYLSGTNVDVEKP